VRTGSIGIVSLTNSAKSKIDLLPNNISSCKGAARSLGRRPRVGVCRSGSPAIRWSVSSGGDHGSGVRRWRTHEDGSRTSLGAVSGQRLWYRSSRGPPGLFSSVRCGLAQVLDLRFGSREGGGDEETRTPDLLLAKEMLYQLSYVPLASREVVVGVSGLEPETSALSGQCSNQLS
jgi:hypothetical protein